MQRPPGIPPALSVRSLPPELARAAREIAVRVSQIGHRAWIVGGAVRDLALGDTPHDVDLCSAATPDELERVFEHTVPLGKAFGTLQIRLGGVEVQHTTFRSDHGYSDGRRPDAVVFGRSLEEDAARRDFTCNALYLAPEDDAFADPTGGLEDIRTRRLRCIGDPVARFSEDGLRLVRMARFAAALGFEIEPATLAAAGRCAERLAGVSPERGLAELERLFARAGSPRAVAILRGAGLLEPLMPGQAALRPADMPLAEADRRRAAALAELEPGPGTALGLAVLCDPAPGELGPADFAGASALLERLRTSRALRSEVLELMQRAREVERLLGGEESRAARLRLVRDRCWPASARLWGAWRRATGRDAEAGRGLRAWADALAPEDLRPAPLLGAEDLERAGVPRGPKWGTLLQLAETEQLELRLATRDQALAWLAERAREN